MYSQRFFPSAIKTVTASLLLVGLGATVGCRIQRAPSRIERAEVHLAKLADAPLPILQQPDVDDASNVMASCGQPNSDTVQRIYSKYYNGPVRRLEYTERREEYLGKRPVTIDFIPSRPRAELAYVEAPLPHEGYGNAQLPANASWRFQAGHMQEEYLITAHRLGNYLPCAGEALRNEF